MTTQFVKPPCSLVASLLLMVGLSSSCVSTKNVPLSAADRAAMRGKTVTVTNRPKPSHWVMKQSAMAAASLGGAVGGAIAGSIAEKEGAEQVAKHHIANPNETMSREVVKSLVGRTGLKQVPSRGTTSSLDAKTVASGNSQADYALDTFTTAWTGLYYPFSMGKYYLMFGAKMQLIETSSGRVVAEGFNLYQGKDRQHAPDYDGIYANGAAFLKVETKKGTDGAIGKFNSQF